MEDIRYTGEARLDVNDHLQNSHVLRALPGRYAGFKRIEPGMDIGVDLGEE